MATKSNSQISDIGDETVTAAVTEAADTPATVLGKNHDDNLSGVMELVTIHSSNEDGGSDAVFVSHNGYAYQIPRNTPCKIPTEVAQGLRDANVTSYKPGKDGAVTEQKSARFAITYQAA